MCVPVTVNITSFQAGSLIPKPQTFIVVVPYPYIIIFKTTRQQVQIYVIVAICLNWDWQEIFKGIWNDMVPIYLDKLRCLKLLKASLVFEQ
jgi:hypothetical protein